MAKVNSRGLIMNVFSVGRRVAGKLATKVDLFERVRREIVAAAERMLQPKGVLAPIRVAADRQKAARSRD
jgi:hypothetical protein